MFILTGFGLAFNPSDYPPSTIAQVHCDIFRTRTDDIWDEPGMPGYLTKDLQKTFGRYQVGAGIHVKTGSDIRAIGDGVVRRLSKNAANTTNFGVFVELEHQYIEVLNEKVPYLIALAGSADKKYGVYWYNPAKICGLQSQ